MAYRNPRSMSSSALYSELESMRDAARAVGRQFQRKAGSFYSAAYEGIAARNRQLFGQALLPKELPSDREGMEAYYRQAQQLLNLESLPVQRAKIRAQKDNLERALDIKIPKWGRNEQKTLSDFLHSDEWKKVYAFGSANAMRELSRALQGGIRLGDSRALQQLKEAFMDFAAGEDLIIEEV